MVGRVLTAIPGIHGHSSPGHGVSGACGPRTDETGEGDTDISGPPVSEMPQATWD
jgi:hypothetical protein